MVKKKTYIKIDESGGAKQSTHNKLSWTEWTYRQRTDKFDNQCKTKGPELISPIVSSKLFTTSSLPLIQVYFILVVSPPPYLLDLISCFSLWLIFTYMVYTHWLTSLFIIRRALLLNSLYLMCYYQKCHFLCGNTTITLTPYI